MVSFGCRSGVLIAIVAERCTRRNGFPGFELDEVVSRLGNSPNQRKMGMMMKIENEGA
jgi:hypothetical protein